MKSSLEAIRALCQYAMTKSPWGISDRWAREWCMSFKQNDKNYVRGIMKTVMQIWIDDFHKKQCEYHILLKDTNELVENFLSSLKGL